MPHRFWKFVSVEADSGLDKDGLVDLVVLHYDDTLFSSILFSSEHGRDRLGATHDLNITDGPLDLLSQIFCFI